MNDNVNLSYSCNNIFTGVIVVCNRRLVAIYTGFIPTLFLENKCECETWL